MANIDIKLESPYTEDMKKIDRENIRKIKNHNSNLDILEGKVIKFERYSKKYFFQVDSIQGDLVKMYPVKKISYNSANNKGIKEQRTATKKDILENSIQV